LALSIGSAAQRPVECIRLDFARTESDKARYRSFTSYRDRLYFPPAIAIGSLMFSSASTSARIAFAGAMVMMLLAGRVGSMPMGRRGSAQLR
jgi:hypothetical protein